MDQKTSSGQKIECDVTRNAFREAMSRVGSAVHIVTSDGDAGRTGFTATAFSAVSDVPPIVLIAVNQNIRSHRILLENGVFCINTLPGHTADLGARFAGRGEGQKYLDRFEQVMTSTVTTGAPVLETALVAFDCELGKTLDIGTHTVFFGHVKAVVYGQKKSALIYKNRAYHVL